jgi:membrane-bound lytic murein transglycosylase D
LVYSRIAPVFRQMKMPRELVLLAGIESSYRVGARSWAGAGGMWQFMPATGRQYRLRQNAWRDERFHLQKSTRAALSYLRTMHAEFKEWEWTLAGYNCGEGRVRSIRRRCPGMSFWQARLLRRCRIPSETRHYVARFFSVLYFLRHPSERPSSVELSRSPALSTFLLSTPVALPYLAKEMGVSLRQLRRWNPELRSWATPPSGSYVLHVPSRLLPGLRRALKRIQSGLHLRTVRIRGSKMLRRFARKVNLSPGFLLAINHVTKRQVRRGVRLLYPKNGAQSKWGTSTSRTLASLARTLLPMAPKLRRLRSKHRAFRYQKRVCHRVRRGDSYWHISRRYGVSISRLRRYNRRRRGLRVGRWVRLSRRTSCGKAARARRKRLARIRSWSTGYSLLYRIPRRRVTRVSRSPQNRKSRVRRRQQRCYRVRRGDTLWSISRKFGMTTKRLARLNRRYRRRLKVGVKLRLRPRVRCM